MAHLPSSAGPSTSTSTSAADAKGGSAERPSTATDASRPVFRIDDTEQRRRQIWDVYNTCLLDNGGTKPSGDGLAPALGNVIVDYESTPKKAFEACAHLEPVQPPELEAATNPRFRDQSLAYVQCMQDRGLWVTLLNDKNTDWTYTPGHPAPADSAEIEDDCLLHAFGDR